MDAIAVRADPAQEEAGAFQGGRGVVDGGGVHVRLAQREAQFRQVGDLVHLPAGRLEQDGGADAAVDVAQRPGRVRVQGAGMRHRTRKVGVDRHVQA